jgi:hypothetical protein
MGALPAWNREGDGACPQTGGLTHGYARADKWGAGVPIHSVHGPVGILGGWHS